jgi:hypothetical protein
MQGLLYWSGIFENQPETGSNIQMIHTISGTQARSGRESGYEIWFASTI